MHILEPWHCARLHCTKTHTVHWDCIRNMLTRTSWNPDIWTYTVLKTNTQEHTVHWDSIRNTLTHKHTYTHNAIVLKTPNPCRTCPSRLRLCATSLMAAPPRPPYVKLWEHSPPPLPAAVGRYSLPKGLLGQSKSRQVNEVEYWRM
jgi:hypothetical protein